MSFLKFLDGLSSDFYRAPLDSESMKLQFADLTSVILSFLFIYLFSGSVPLIFFSVKLPHSKSY